MQLHKAWQKTGFWLGAGWGLFWAAVLSNLALVPKLDLTFYDRLIRLDRPSSVPPEILLVKIEADTLKTWGIAKEAVAYSNLARRLLEEGAAVVILNLLPHWVQTSDRIDHPIKTLVKQHRDRVVLVLPTTRISEPTTTKWRNYEYFLPSNDRSELLFFPPTVLGFSEYEPEAKNPVNLASTARQAFLSGCVTLGNAVDRTEHLKSAAWLGLEKFQGRFSYALSPEVRQPIHIHFWGKTGTFPTLDARSLSADRPEFPSIRDKIIILGFGDLNSPNTFAIRSPFEDTMPGIELQANLLASLLTQSYYRSFPVWLQGIAIVAGSILLGQWIVWGAVKPAKFRRVGYWLFPLLLLGSLALLSGGLLWQRWIFPVTLPLLTWMATGLSVFVSLRFGIQQELINQQQCEIDRLHRVEQTAVISQSRKLLHRIASNIHDGPLQQLKLVMDGLELLQMNSTAVDLNPILDRLEDLGNHLREQLNQTRAIALEITPELREGLDSAIAKKLQALVESGELTLPVTQNLQSLNEPQLNSLWLEAREDIYRFFAEAIANVTHHAQPPQGMATRVKVSLEQQGDRGWLAIENDGKILDASAFEITSQQRRRGGYGTKLMETIAAELPAGKFERITLSEGGMRVELSWKMLFDEE